MPPLITREEALRLGELEDHAEIEALVERAWRARVERFDDSTDLCSLVNAKSGGCAEDCGFCAQSRFAEAETPMHAMMSAEQILEHAKAAEAAGAHRFCMVTQGQGLSKRDFEAILEGARLVAEQTNLKRCASIGHMSVKRAQQLKDAGIQRVHHNVETARSYYPEVSSTVQYEGRLRTIEAVREAGLETCVGGILNLGESREQRVEMAFELAAIDPTSVPINLLNPRPGTKFGDRDYMDPWEAVKWIAIFRLILPDALFRLCGGRTENLADLQQLAVKAGINGVMLGNFLTTLGNQPEEDHAMFEELGLNIAAQPDNGANPRPDNRSGWLEGETPDPVGEHIARRRAGPRASPSGIPRRSCATARSPPCHPGPTAAPTAGSTARPRRQEPHAGSAGPTGRAQGARPLSPHAHGERSAGPARRPRRQARPAAVLEQLPRARRPPARARGGGRRGDALGRRRGGVAARVGQHDAAPAARGAPRGVQGHAERAAVRLGLPGEPRRDPGAGAARRGRVLRRAQPRLDHRRLPARGRGDVRLPPRRPRAPRLGPAPRGRARRADRHRRRLLDGRRRRAAGGDRRARAPPRRARDGRRRARHRHARARAAAARSPRPGSRARST